MCSYLYSHCFYNLTDHRHDYNTSALFLFVFLLPGLFTLIAVSVWGDYHQQYFNTKEGPGLWDNIGVLDWAFGLAVTDCVLTFIAVGLMIAGIAM